MATIKIRRTNDYINFLRDYRLFIDGQKIGTIGNGQTKDFEITVGRHSVIAKIDWCSSQKLSFDINDTDSKILLVCSFKNGKWIIPAAQGFMVLCIMLIWASHFYSLIILIIPTLLLLLYYFTIGYKNYLTLTELYTVFILFMF